MSFHINWKKSGCVLIRRRCVHMFASVPIECCQCVRANGKVLFPMVRFSSFDIIKCLYVVATYLTTQNTARLRYTQRIGFSLLSHTNFFPFRYIYIYIVVLHGWQLDIEYCNTCEFTRIRASSVWWLCMCTV